MLRYPGRCFTVLSSVRCYAVPSKQGSVVGIWSFAIWSLVRVFGAATDCRHLSFAGPRPSGKVRSFAPKNDRLATERRSATPRWPRHVSFFLFFSKIQPTFIYPAPSYGRANAPTCAFPDRLCWVVPCRGARALWCKHRLRCGSGAGFCAGLR